MKCSKCGADNSDHSVFCETCGAFLKKSVESDIPREVVQPLDNSGQEDIEIIPTSSGEADTQSNCEDTGEGQTDNTPTLGANVSMKPSESESSQMAKAGNDVEANKEVKNVKIPFYLQIWFIVILFLSYFGIIPAIILLIIRIKKYPKRKGDKDAFD